MDRRDLQVGPDREDAGTTDRSGLTPRRKGRLPPERMYPAGVPGVVVRYVTLDTGIAVRTIESGSSDGDQAVILVHGWAECVYSFAETLPALAASGLRVIAFDLPGHGLSDKPTDDAAYTTRALADVILKVADSLGVGRFSLVAHSMGGSLALDLATRGERRLERVVLINAVGLARAPILGPIRVLPSGPVNRIVPLVLRRSVVALILRLAFGTRQRPTSRDIDEYWAPTQFDEFAWACRACIHRVTWSRLPATKLRSLRLPVLVITGGRDLIIRGSASRARLIPSARIVKIREGGHLVMQECASATNAELVPFLRDGRVRR